MNNFQPYYGVPYIYPTWNEYLRAIRRSYYRPGFWGGVQYMLANMFNSGRWPKNTEEYVAPKPPKPKKPPVDHDAEDFKRFIRYQNIESYTKFINKGW
jgi:hypothetical protein